MKLKNSLRARQQVGSRVVDLKHIFRIQLVQLMFAVLAVYRSVVVSEGLTADTLWLVGTIGSMLMLILLISIATLQSPMKSLYFDSTTSADEVREYLASFLFDDKYQVVERFIRGGQFDQAREFVYAGLSPTRLLRTLHRNPDDPKEAAFRQELEECEAVYQILVASSEVSWRRPRDFRKYYMSPAVRRAAATLPGMTVQQFDELLHVIPTTTSDLL